jgi:hypothetical protein
MKAEIKNIESVKVWRSISEFSSVRNKFDCPILFRKLSEKKIFHINFDRKNVAIQCNSDTRIDHYTVHSENQVQVNLRLL